MVKITTGAAGYKTKQLLPALSRIILYNRGMEINISLFYSMLTGFGKQP